MARAKTLHVCHINRGGPKIHPCRRVQEKLDDQGHSYEVNVFDRNRPAGLFTKGKRPALKRLTGQEKLPVLELDDGTMIFPSRKIVKWAKSNPAAA